MLRVEGQQRHALCWVPQLRFLSNGILQERVFRSVRITERPRIGTKQPAVFFLQEMPTGRATQGIRQLRSTCEGLSIRARLEQAPPREGDDEASMRPDHQFSQDAAPAPIPTSACSADRVSGPYPRRTFAGAITNASAQAPAPGEKHGA
ncbi:hypothetical protein THAR02_04539 [Trichoderma harzianum]|uniref:Uncharacterized protein n=1 Tax=Trichoderma harzianum TaxID=5544 RepID=A0A0F9ZSX0_TRIHA|nr:hypothetical protein THAR02_04539 [Trichoderma harzianum]